MASPFSAVSENIASMNFRNKISGSENSRVQKRPALAVLNSDVALTANPCGLSFKSHVFGEENLFQKNFSRESQSSYIFKVPTIPIYEDKDDFPPTVNENLPPNKSLKKCIPLYDISDENAVFSGDFKQDSFMNLDLSINEPEARFASIHLKSPYGNETYWYLREMEKKYRPLSTYMRKQPDITMSMRSILVDWLVEVCNEYQLQTETLYLAVSYIDRFLSAMSVLRGKLQLVGTASMFIASKYEEVYPPELKDFVYVTDDTYTKRQILGMEHLMLKVLSFDLAVPTAYFFLKHFCFVSDSPEMICFLSQYICELSLLEVEPFLKYLPSEIAASSLALANYTLGFVPWSEELEKASGYKLIDLLMSINILCKRCKNISKYPEQAICEKYRASRFRCVSKTQFPAHVIC